MNAGIVRGPDTQNVSGQGGAGGVGMRPEAIVLCYRHLAFINGENVSRWLESVLVESLPPVTQLEDRLQNGVVLCKLGMRLLPLDSMWSKVYDLEEKRYKVGVGVGVVG